MSPRKGQKKRWFWGCTYFGHTNRDEKRCRAKAREPGFENSEQAFDAALRHKHVSSTWMPVIWSEFR